MAHPRFFAVNCNNLGISAKEQFREWSRVVATVRALVSEAIGGFGIDGARSRRSRRYRPGFRTAP